MYQESRLIGGFLSVCPLVLMTCIRVFLSSSVFLSALSESVKACGAEALALLGQMKQQDSLSAADNGKLRAALEAILATAEVHVHKYCTYSRAHNYSHFTYKF